MILNSKIDRNSLISHIEENERAIICSVFEEWGRRIVEEQKRERVGEPKSFVSRTEREILCALTYP